MEISSRIIRQPDLTKPGYNNQNMRKITLAFTLLFCMVWILAFQTSPSAAQGSSPDDRIDAGHEVVYDILDAAYVSGAHSLVTLVPSTVGTPSATPPPISPVVVATPAADGSITHQVGYGQTLIGIAEAYKITLADLLALNGLNSASPIFEGQKLVIALGATPTVTPTITDTAEPTDAPTSTRLPPTPTPKPTGPPTITPTPTSAPLIDFSTVRINQRTAGIAIIAICALGLVLVGITSFRGK